MTVETKYRATYPRPADSPADSPAVWSVVITENEDQRRGKIILDQQEYFATNNNCEKTK